MKLVFDIDDTILYTEYRNGTYILKGYDIAIKQIINHEYKIGTEIVLQTARHWNLLELTRDQLKRAGIKYNTLVMGKPVADLYIDDRAMRPEEFVKTFKSNYGGKRWQMI